MNNNQTENIKDELRRIAAKQTLGLPLSDCDNAILTLYGQPATTADAATVPQPAKIDTDKMVQEINKRLSEAR